MDNWRKQKGEFHHHHQEGHQAQGGRRSHYRKPPQAHVGSLLFLHGRKSSARQLVLFHGESFWKPRGLCTFIKMLFNGMTAVEEAFHNAKTRFWAAMNDLPCDLSLPDPDIYIDEIDWNSDVDPELLLDLEREPKATEEVDKDKKVVILNSLLNQSFSCTGWGDTEQGFKKDTDLCVASNRGDCTQNAGTGNVENSWERNCAPGAEAIKDDGWGRWNNSSKLNQHDHHYNNWDNSYNESWNVNNRSAVDWGMGDRNSKKKEGTGWYMSRYKTSRFQGDDDYRVDHGWKNRKGYNKRYNFACESPFPDGKNSSRQWNSVNSCGPISHNRFGKEGISWGWEKQVL